MCRHSHYVRGQQNRHELASNTPPLYIDLQRSNTWTNMIGAVEQRMAMIDTNGVIDGANTSFPKREYWVGY